jgi:membrane-bound ClpP family serine protease
MDSWVWSVLLLIAGLTLAALEVFVPSGGIIGFLSVGTLISAVVVAFWHSKETGALVLAACIFGVPGMLVLAFRVWPHTRFGRQVLLDVPSQDEVLPDSPKRRDLKALIGRVGRAKTAMLLSGAVSIDGRSYDAVSDSAPIEVGQAVRVLRVNGMEVVVRRLEDGEAFVHRSPDDPLSQPIDTVAADPFEEPPA